MLTVVPQIARISSGSDVRPGCADSVGAAEEGWSELGMAFCEGRWAMRKAGVGVRASEEWMSPRLFTTGVALLLAGDELGKFMGEELLTT